VERCQQEKIRKGGDPNVFLSFNSLIFLLPVVPDFAMGHIDIYATISMMLVEVENVKLATFKDHKVWMAQVKYESARYWHLNIVLHKLLCGHDSATGKFSRPK
jgi:hypothetical protein